MPEYPWTCLHIPKYTGVSVNMAKSLWMAFVLHFTFLFPCLFEHVVICFTVCTKLENIVKVHGAFFFTRQNSIFFIVTGNISFNFCFKPNILTSKASNLRYLCGLRGAGPANLDMPTSKSWTTTKHWNQINRGRWFVKPCYI